MPNNFRTLMHTQAEGAAKNDPAEPGRQPVVDPASIWVAASARPGEPTRHQLVQDPLASRLCFGLASVCCDRHGERLLVGLSCFVRHDDPPPGCQQVLRVTTVRSGAERRAAAAALQRFDLPGLVCRGWGNHGSAWKSRASQRQPERGRDKLRGHVGSIELG